MPEPRPDISKRRLHQRKAISIVKILENMTSETDTLNSIFIDAIRDMREDGTFRFRARGASMWPVINDGDVLVVKKTGANEARPGDIVVGEVDGKITAHRLVEKTVNNGVHTLRTQGDALPWADDALSASDLLGVVTAVEKQNSKIRLDSEAAKISSAMFLLVNRIKRLVVTRVSGASGPFAGKLPKTTGGESSASWRTLYRWATFLPYKVLTFVKESEGK